MSKRLQVLIDEAEYREIARLARAEGTTIAAWVREAIRNSRRSKPPERAADKLRVVRAAARHEFPTGDLTQMLEEIERGYTGSPALRGPSRS